MTRHSFGLTLGALVVAFFVVYFAPRIFISIYPGQAGVLWKRFQGTLTEPEQVYSEGFYLILPIDVMFIYDLRYHVLVRRVNVLTRDGLEITAEVGLLYRVRKELVGELHQEVGERYVDSLIIPTLEAAARNILAAIDARAAYVDKPLALGETDLFERSLLDRAKGDVGGKYIEVEDLSIMRIVLPGPVQEAIQRKHAEEQLALMYDYRLQREEKEAQRKRIEAGGIKDFQDTIIGGLSERYLKFKGIEATLELAKSPNSKVIVIGNTEGLPLILGAIPQDVSKGTDGTGASASVQISPPQPDQTQSKIDPESLRELGFGSEKAGPLPTSP